MRAGLSLSLYIYMCRTFCVYTLHTDIYIYMYVCMYVCMYVGLGYICVYTNTHMYIPVDACFKSTLPGACRSVGVNPEKSYEKSGTPTKGLDNFPKARNPRNKF